MNDDITALQFSTAHYPERERIAAWRETLGRHVLRAEIEPKDPEHFHAEAIIRVLPNVGIMTGAFGAARFVRPKGLIDTDDVVLTLGMSGAWVRQGQHEATAGEGDGLFAIGGESGEADTPASRFTMIRIPLAPLAQSIRAAASIRCRRIPADSSALRLLKQYLPILDSPQAISTLELREHAATHIQDLVSVAIGASRDAEEVARNRGLRAAQQRAVLDFVARNAGEPGLDPARAADYLGISVRYLHRVLETTGRTFSQHLLEQRLSFALAALRDPACRSRIADIALASGFSDISHFNRAFRRTFGDTPYGVRVRAARERA